VKNIILFTGFPGFLGSELLPRVLTRAPEARAVCLVQGKFADLAQKRRLDLETEQPELAGRVELAQGDITLPDLGLDDPETLLADTVEIFHLAAVYDLMVKREVGLAVNVEGTQNILNFAEECPRLERLHYVSTCFVSGRHAGIYSEDDLDKGQEFNNYYEETKFLAEVEVQTRMSQGLPVSIYRPPIVVGDSVTGATQKYDGPYFIIRWLLRQPSLAILPSVGDPEAVRVNLVPRDFVVRAIAHLSGLEESAGQIYQLADSHPLTVAALIDAVARETHRKVVRVPLPRFAAKAAIDYVPGVYRLMQIPSAAIDYFVHPTHYTSVNTVRDLAGTDIEVPRLETYLGRLVDFTRAHPEVGSAAMA